MKGPAPIYPRVNLASRPFRNERLPMVLTWTAAAVIAVLTVVHVVAIRRVLPGGPGDVRAEVAALQARAADLRSAAEARSPRPDRDTLKEWVAVRSLVDARAFSWTELLTDLEAALPRGVRLMAISPEVRTDYVQLSLNAVARQADSALELITSFQARPEFTNVYPLHISEREGGEALVDYVVRYTPRPDPPAPQPSPGAQPEAAAPAPQGSQGANP